ncbi:MAG TPA: hypothetical protein VLA37_12425, partial [Sphingomonadaceae bacterium]|nr:hypothetical protein [Sphingomonadaceae bacterium]
AEPFDLGLVATGEGRLTTCRSKKRDAQFEVTAVYLTDSPEIDLGNEVTGGGPDLIYWIGLITSPETQDNDLAEYRAFVSRLSLDGGGFRIKP